MIRLWLGFTILWAGCASVAPTVTAPMEQPRTLAYFKAALPNYFIVTPLPAASHTEPPTIVAQRLRQMQAALLTALDRKGYFVTADPAPAQKEIYGVLTLDYTTLPGSDARHWAQQIELQFHTPSGGPLGTIASRWNDSSSPAIDSVLAPLLASALQRVPTAKP